MTDMPDFDLDDEEEELGPSYALSPLYVLRTSDYCPECRQVLHVFMLGSAAYHDAEDGEAIEHFHFLCRIESLPDAVMAMLRDKCPGFYPDAEPADDEGQPYLMNHCPCGARLDDDYLHGDVGAAFWPDTPKGFGQFELFRLPIAGAIPIVCSIMLGGGEYLDYANAQTW